VRAEQEAAPEGGRRALFEQSLDATLADAGLDFLDPWGNRVQVVQYSKTQFTKAP